MKNLLCTILFTIIMVVSYAQNQPDGFFDENDCYMDFVISEDTMYRIDFFPILYYENESYMNESNGLYIVPNCSHTEELRLPTKRQGDVGENFELYLLTDGITIYGSLARSEDQWLYLYLDGTSNIVDFLSTYQVIEIIHRP